MIPVMMALASHDVNHSHWSRMSGAIVRVLARVVSATSFAVGLTACLAACAARTTQAPDFARTSSTPVPRSAIAAAKGWVNSTWPGGSGTVARQSSWSAGDGWSGSQASSRPDPYGGAQDFWSLTSILADNSYAWQGSAADPVLELGGCAAWNTAGGERDVASYFRATEPKGFQVIAHGDGWECIGIDPVSGQS
jgi:hypothetical protein